MAGVKPRLTFTEEKENGGGYETQQYEMEGTISTIRINRTFEKRANILRI